MESVRNASKTPTKNIIECTELERDALQVALGGCLHDEVAHLQWHGTTSMGAHCARARRVQIGATSEARGHTSVPTSVEPVNAILSTSGCEESAAPAVGPKPGTTLRTPAGKPASFASAARNSAGQRFNRFAVNVD